MHTSRKKIAKIFPKASKERVKEFYETMNEFADQFAITTETQENFFLAQVLAETGKALSAKRENLNYTPKSLRATFKRYKNNPKWSERDGRTSAHRANQVNIGNVAYAGRIGNGNIASGDGYKFRGGGYFQLTGRANYARMAKVIQRTIGDAVGPENIVSGITEPTMGVLSAMAFWLDNKCYKCKNIDCITKKINRYTDTYQKRKALYKMIAKL